MEKPLLQLAWHQPFVLCYAMLFSMDPSRLRSIPLELFLSESTWVTEGTMCGLHHQLLWSCQQECWGKGHQTHPGQQPPESQGSHSPNPASGSQSQTGRARRESSPQSLSFSFCSSNRQQRGQNAGLPLLRGHYPSQWAGDWLVVLAHRWKNGG